MGQNANRIAQEAFDVAHPGALELRVGGRLGIDALDFVDGADEIVEGTLILRGQAEAPAAEKIDLEAEADGVAVPGAGRGDELTVDLHAAAQRRGPDTVDEVGVGLPVELERVGGEVEGKAVFGETLHLHAETERERGGGIEIDAAPAVGKLRMGVPVGEAGGKLQRDGLTVQKEGQRVVIDRGVADENGDAGHGGSRTHRVVLEGYPHLQRHIGTEGKADELDGFVRQQRCHRIAHRAFREIKRMNHTRSIAHSAARCVRSERAAAPRYSS